MLQVLMVATSNLHLQFRYLTSGGRPCNTRQAILNLMPSALRLTEGRSTPPPGFILADARRRFVDLRFMAGPEVIVEYETARIMRR